MELTSTLKTGIFRAVKITILTQIKEIGQDREYWQRVENHKQKLQELENNNQNQRQFNKLI